MEAKMKEFEDLLAADLSDLEKMTKAFRRITDQIIEYSTSEIELIKAMDDPEALVKEQIKMSTLRHAQQIFQECHMMLFGRKAWDD
jgi:hypothetical protein